MKFFVQIAIFSVKNTKTLNFYLKNFLLCKHFSNKTVSMGEESPTWTLPKINRLVHFEFV